MEQCPQCQNERIPGENFCDNCGHKFAEAPQAEPEAPEIHVEPEAQEAPPTAGPQAGVYVQGGSGELPIYFEDSPRIIGRGDMSEFLKSQNIDPLQISRKQCTISKEGGEYYLEDGVTSVQDKPSSNHTTVNGRDVTGQGRIKLSDNDAIEFATIVKAVFRSG